MSGKKNRDNGNGVNHLYTYFDVDDLNRVSAHRTKKYLSLSGKWQWTKRAHGYNGTGSLVNTTMKQWFDGDSEPAGDSLEHIYDRGRMLQNYDGSSTYGDQWRWAGAQHSHNSPVYSPNSDTSSQTGYNLANDKTPQRRTFLSPTSEGDQRNLYGQGKPQAKDSSGSGANWYVGTTSQPQTAQMASIESRLFFEGTVTATDMDRASDTREKGRIGITGSAQSYGGSNGRVTSEAIGRDVNPLGRGGGAALVGGMMNLGNLTPSLPGGRGEINQGNSVNNACLGCPGSPYGDPQQNPGNGGGDKEGDASELPNCVQEWLNEMQDWQGPTSCPIPYCVNEPCNCNYCNMTEWGENPQECWDRYCACTHCGCPVPTTCPQPVNCRCNSNSNNNPNKNWCKDGNVEVMVDTGLITLLVAIATQIGAVIIALRLLANQVRQLWWLIMTLNVSVASGNLFGAVLAMIGITLTLKRLGQIAASALAAIALLFGAALAVCLDKRNDIALYLQGQGLSFNASYQIAVQCLWYCKPFWMGTGIPSSGQGGQGGGGTTGPMFI